MSIKGRKWRNFLLEPMTQVKIGVYCIATSLVFAVGLVGVIFWKFRVLATNILDLTDVPDELRDIIQDNWNGTQLWIYSIVGLYIFVIIALSIWYTHSMVGPIVAFKRHIEKLKSGDYSARTTVRKGDSFGHIADALNDLSDTLRNKK